MAKRKIAIVGGGVAGLYTGWRLLCKEQQGGNSGELEERGEYEVTVYEAAEFVGGRLLSINPSDLLAGKRTKKLADKKEAHCELGGMRIPEGFDNYVKSLVCELKASGCEILETAPFPTDADENWHYLRGFVQTTSTLRFGPYGQYIDCGMPYRPHENEVNSIRDKGIGGPIFDALTGGDDPIIEREKMPRAATKNGTKGKNIFGFEGLNIFDFVMYALDREVTLGEDKQLKLSEVGFADLFNSSGEHAKPYSWNVSNEYWNLFSTAGGYDTIPASWNAATATVMILSDFSGPPDFKILKSGYRALPVALCSEIKGLGGSVMPNMVVQSIQVKDGKVTLDVRKVTTTPCRDGTTKTTLAKQPEKNTDFDAVVLALPPRAIELLLNRSGDFAPRNSEVRRKLADVTPIPLLKLYLMYKLHDGKKEENEKKEKKGWWEDVIGKMEQYTRTTTDLPLRQTYNFGTYIDTDDDDKEYAVLQVSYDDNLNPGYWAGLIPSIENVNVSTGIWGRPHAMSEAASRPIAPLIMNLTEYQTYADLREKAAVFAVAHAQFMNFVNRVAEATGKDKLDLENRHLLPKAGAVMDWAVDPFGGGVNFWNVGVDVSKEYWNMMHPFDREPDHSGTCEEIPIYVVGEGYSVFQGWVEGALWTAEAVLKNKFGLKKPKWAPFDVSKR